MDSHSSMPGPDSVAMAGTSTAMRDVERALRRLAGTDVNLLLYGESGVGKCALAKTIHADSPRVDAPLLTLSPAGRAETDVEHELFGAGENGLLAAARG